MHAPDFPLDEFRPQWVLAEWPDRWPMRDRMLIIAWHLVLSLAGGDEPSDDE